MTGPPRQTIIPYRKLRIEVGMEGAEAMGKAFKRRKRTPAACAAISLLLLIATLGCGSSPRSRKPPNSVGGTADVRILNTEGRPLESFFKGLPVDPRFANGKNPYLLKRPACQAPAKKSALTLTFPSLSRLSKLAGVGPFTVHAQSSCGLCDQGLDLYPCGETCPDGQAQVVVYDGSNPQLGSYDSGTDLCQGSCPVDIYQLCYNPTCPP